MPYRDLKRALEDFTDEQLELEVLVFDSGIGDLVECTNIVTDETTIDDVVYPYLTL